MKKYLFVSTLLLNLSGYAQDSIRHIQLEEVSINAVRAAVNIPISQKTIQKKEIQSIDIGQDAALHLERLSPSIISYSDAGTNFGNYQSFRLRGMDQSRINITLNGVPLNDMLDQGVFFSNITDFSNSVESIQIQRGIGTSTNGTSSYAGSINYESASLYKEKPSAGLRIIGGSFGTFGSSAEVNTGKMDNKISAYGRLSKNVSNGYKDNSSSNAQSFFFSGGYLGEKHQLKLLALVGKTANEQSYLPVLESDIIKNPKTNYNSANDKDDFEQEMIQLNYGYLIKNDLFFDATAYYSGARGYFPFDIGGGTQFNYGIRNDQYGLLLNTHKYSQFWDFHAGIHSYTFLRRNSTNISPDFAFPFYEDKSMKNEIAAFVKLNRQFKKVSVYGDFQIRTLEMGFESDSLSVFSGSSISTRNYSFFNPKVGLNFQISNNQSAYISVGRTGREPTRTDIFRGAGDAVYSFNYNSIIEPDSVKAEYVNDLEIGHRYSNNKIRWSFNGFYMSFENEISAVGGLAQNTYFVLRQNVKSSQRYGLEMDLSYFINTSFQFDLMATYLNTNVDNFNNGFENFENVQQVFSPNIILNPQLSYRFKELLTLGFNARYLSESFMELSNNSDYLIPESLIFNLFLNAEINKNLSIGVFLNNMTNERYYTDGAPVDLDFDGSPEGPGYRIQAPRNIYFKLGLRF